MTATTTATANPSSPCALFQVSQLTDDEKATMPSVHIAMHYIRENGKLHNLNDLEMVMTLDATTDLYKKYGYIGDALPVKGKVTNQANGKTAYIDLGFVTSQGEFIYKVGSSNSSGLIYSHASLECIGLAILCYLA